MDAPYQLICLVFALVFFGIAATWWAPPSEPHRYKLIAAGLFAYILSLLVSA